jgi:hypothetical protein
MNNDCEDTVLDLKQRIEAGEYTVDPTAVADAIVRRLRDIATAQRENDMRRADCSAAGAGEQAQKLCSYPASSAGPSVNTTPAGPGTTAPIQIKRRWSLRTLLENAALALAGTQTQSS